MKLSFFEKIIVKREKDFIDSVDGTLCVAGFIGSLMVTFSFFLCCALNPSLFNSYAGTHVAPVFVGVLIITSARLLLHVLLSRTVLRLAEYKNAVMQLSDTVQIRFSLFEGSYSRNSSAWELCENCVKRFGKTCIFSYRDYKKYKRFLQQAAISAFEARISAEEEREMNAVLAERSRFEAAPEAYVTGRRKPVLLKFERPQKEYARLERDMAAYRNAVFLADVMDDYRK